MNNYSINIYHLYPHLLNLYGDSGNIAVLKKRCEWHGIEANVIEINDDGDTNLDDTDIILFGGGTESDLRIVRDYAASISAQVNAYIDRGGVMLALCEGYYMLGKSFPLGGVIVDGLGLLNIHTTASERRFAENVVIKSTLDGVTMDIVGFENHIGEVHIGDLAPFGDVICGFGNDATSTHEGVMYKNTIGTHLHGPLLPKNPELADYMIRHALINKYGEDVVLDENSTIEDANGSINDTNSIINDTNSIINDTMEIKAKRFMIEREIARMQARQG